MYPCSISTAYLFYWHLFSHDSSGATRKTLESRGYDFVRTIEWCSTELMQELEDNWAKHASKNFQIQQPPTFQFGFCI